MNYTNPSKIQAAILDWAGTVVDFGSFAPTQIFVEAFAEFDVQVSIEEARGPMGMGKWDHIRTLCDQPQITERYKKVFGRAPTDEDVTLALDPAIAVIEAIDGGVVQIVRAHRLQDQVR